MRGPGAAQRRMLQNFFAEVYPSHFYFDAQVAYCCDSDEFVLSPDFIYWSLIVSRGRQPRDGQVSKHPLAFDWPFQHLE